MARKIVILFVIMLLPVVSFAKNSVQVLITVDRTTVSLGESISLRLEVVGERSVKAPDLDEVKAFEVNYVGTSSQYQIINGKSSSSKIFNYMLIPLETGSFTVGPIVVNADRRNYKSNAVNIIVSENVISNDSERTAFLSLDVSNTETYINEQIICKVTFASRVEVLGANLEPPKFTGFWKESLGDNVSYQTVINGQLWNVSELKWALFPTNAGEITIPPIRVTASLASNERRRRGSVFDSPFFNGGNAIKRTFRTKPTKIFVKPLPAGKPNDFYGLVGSFSMNMSAPDQESKVGDSITLNIVISGNGNIRDVIMPSIESNNDFKIYKDEPKYSARVNEKGLLGTKKFTLALVPLVSGKSFVPSLKLPTFDPISNKYITYETKSFYLDVLPSDKKEVVDNAIPAFNSAKKEITILGNDLSSINQNIDSLENQNINMRDTIVILIFLIAPAGIFVFLWLLRRRFVKVHKDRYYLRRIKAFSNAKKRHSKLKKIEDKKEFCMYSAKSLKLYIGDKLGVDGLALTPIDMERYMTSKNINADLISKAKEFINKCDSANYGGYSLSENEIREMREKSINIVKQIEKEVG